MKIVDTLGGIAEISLPKSGILQVDQDLQDVDTDTLQDELRQFYGDRLVLEFGESVVPDPAVVPAKPAKRSTKAKTVKDGVSNSD